MEAAAYWLALLTVVLVPPFLTIWFLVHPFARFWRRLGPTPTYLICGAIIASLVALLFHFHQPLLRARFGPSPVLAVIAALFFLASLTLGVQIRKQLSLSVLFGLPELSPTRSGSLLTEGLYARIRHPRYLQVCLSLTAFALFCNYLATWVVWAAYFPVVYLVVLMEERELRDRFGEEYERYARRVPRFLPRVSRRPRSG